MTRPLLPGVLLAVLACLPIGGTLLVAQILPQMEQAFAGTPDLRLRVSLALTIPALAIAICSWGAGWLADHVGKRRLLIIALLFYALFGLAPLLLDSLDAIIGVRAGMGVAEGIIMTCSTALIGDLYTDGQRERLLSLQTACASLAAVAFAIIGGALGEFGWRAPFAVYGIALIALPAVLLLVPAGTGRAPSGRGADDGAGRLPLAILAPICATTLLLSLCFYVAQIQIPYLLNAIGTVSPTSVGLVSAMTNAAVVAGTLCFGLTRRLPLRTTNRLCFLLIGLGLGLISVSQTYGPLCVGLVITSFAGGIALPTLLNGAMAVLSSEQRGSGAGLWQSSFWAGQFASPILIIMLASFAGGLSAAVALCAVGGLVLGLMLSLKL
ncbi:MFS transporter [Sphingomonas prati]|uniref:MFS family permease n=1 Tax=Sphingomonas prati TaxID=1843237 RepID=A0A7W9BVG1_9SPHN|nr:MFS transporter [Sphingomonas prati]MBB5730750.1 MFS family permease [Sphingomonas prati]